MLTMEDRFYGHGDSPVVAGDDGGGSGEELEDGEHLMIDLDALIKILDDNSDPTQVGLVLVVCYRTGLREPGRLMSLNSVESWGGIDYLALRCMVYT